MTFLMLPPSINATSAMLPVTGLAHVQEFGPVAPGSDEATALRAAMKEHREAVGPELMERLFGVMWASVDLNTLQPRLPNPIWPLRPLETADEWMRKTRGEYRGTGIVAPNESNIAAAQRPSVEAGPIAALTETLGDIADDPGAYVREVADNIKEGVGTATGIVLAPVDKAGEVAGDLIENITEGLGGFGLLAVALIAYFIARKGG